MSGKQRRWSDDQLRDAVPRARSMRGLLALLGLRPGGGQYVLMRGHIARLNLDTAHFTGQGWNTGNHSEQLNTSPRRTLADILVRGSTFQNTAHLKRRLVSADLLRHRCDTCEQPPEWRGKPLVLRLDHINGDRSDNRLVNLRLLCPNCDSQTPTFAGRNKGWNRRRSEPAS